MVLKYKILYKRIHIQDTGLIVTNDFNDSKQKQRKVKKLMKIASTIGKKISDGGEKRKNLECKTKLEE